MEFMDNATPNIDLNTQVTFDALADTGELKVCVLSSGSKGNAVYISDGETSLLLDAGLSAREIENRLYARGLCPRDLTAILISHHHSDHVKGVGPMARRFGLPVYTLEITVEHCSLGNLKCVHYFQKGQTFRINRLSIHPFDTPHDAADSVGFVITRGDKKIGIATDLGVITNVVRQHLCDCNILILEANHDPDMLLNGPYPWYLKQRIKSRDGHLSNYDCRAFLDEIMHDELEHVILAHLSEANNTPEKVLETVGTLFTNRATCLTVALQHVPTEIIICKGNGP